MMEFKIKYGRDYPMFTLNILRFPSFQSPLVLPPEIKTRYKDSLIEWKERHKHSELMHEHEHNHLQRLIDYLDVVKTPHSESFEMPKLLNDFRHFYAQYDHRRNKNFSATFPTLSDWYNDIQI
jgi:hypothetical protein